MKKYLLIAAATLVFVGCAENDTFKKDIIDNSGENGGVIGFTSYTEKVTKAENSEALYTWTFYEHQDSFQVWARKANQPTKEIFDGTKVTVTREGTAGNYTYTYRYDPARFWDKNASEYHFYAAAPARNSAASADWKWTFKDEGIDAATTINAGYFKIENAFSLNGVNLKHVDNGGADATLDNVFKNVEVSSTNDATDIDLLIAAPTQVAQTYYNKPIPDAVNLNFIHILSKLNIRVSTSLGTVQDVDNANHTYDVKLLGFQLHLMPNAGTFDESSANFSSSKKQIRWTRSGATTTEILTGISSTATEDVPLTTGDKLYIVESLVMPQNIDYERVALDGAAHDAINSAAVPFASYAAYEEARDNDATRLTEAQFNALFDNGSFVAWSAYVQVAGETIDEDEFNSRVADATDIPAINIAAYTAPTKPYFTITYSIDGEEFTANYNLAAAFLNYNNNSQKPSATGLVNLEDSDPTVFGFFEGWQNTLNIIINPTKIEFTADVAEWSSTEEKSYEIEKNNETPNN